MQKAFGQDVYGPCTTAEGDKYREIANDLCKGIEGFKLSPKPSDAK